MTSYRTISASFLVLTSLLTGCGGGTSNHYISANFVTTATPLNSQVHVIGDSFWDYGSPNYSQPAEAGRVLQAITRNNNKVFKDHSRTNAAISDINKVQVPEIVSDQTNDQIRTILVNGGANDLKDSCSTAAYNSNPGKCTSAIDATVLKRKELLNTLLNLEGNTVETVVMPSLITWSPEKFPKSATSEYDLKIKEICNLEPVRMRCLFVDISSLWTTDNASDFILPAPDKLHVNNEGAKLVGDAIWQAMRNAGVHGYESQ